MSEHEGVERASLAASVGSLTVVCVGQARALTAVPIGGVVPSLC